MCGFSFTWAYTIMNVTIIQIAQYTQITIGYEYV